MFTYKDHITPDGNVIIRYDSLLPVFDACKEKNIAVNWIRRFFKSTGADIAVVGISGGKDSSVVAALCVEALGADNVVGVKMPCGAQHDIGCADRLIEHLGIKSVEYDIAPVVEAFSSGAASASISGIEEGMWANPASDGYVMSKQAYTNLLPRTRLCVLYMVSQSLRPSARIVGTANLSESYIGWDTRYGGSGASGSDLLPIANYTATEVCALGHVLHLPEDLIDKVPEDGLTGTSDEEALGFSYAELDMYIRIGRHAPIDESVMDKIAQMHKRNEFKLRMPPSCFTDLRVLAGN